MFIILGWKWPELSLIDALVCTDQSNDPIAGFQGEGEHYAMYFYRLKGTA